MDEKTTLTLNYYARSAVSFFEGTVGVEFSETRDRFLAKLPSGSSILDLGCGSGRDTKAFLDHGFQVTAADGSPELCALAAAYTGIPVRQMLFEELEDKNAYDGIWACASLLHISSAELPKIFRRIITALKPGGLLYVSFKYGSFEGERNGRHFTDFTEDSFAAFMSRFPELKTEDLWISADARPERSVERWLNCIIRYEV